MASTTQAAPETHTGVKLPVLEREKLILSGRSYHWITERICGVVENKQPLLWWLLFIPVRADRRHRRGRRLVPPGFHRRRCLGKHQPRHVGLADRELRVLDRYRPRRNPDFRDSFPHQTELADLDQPRRRGHDDLRGDVRRHFPGLPRRPRVVRLVPRAGARTPTASGRTSSRRCCGTCSRFPPISPSR